MVPLALIISLEKEIQKKFIFSFKVEAGVEKKTYPPHSKVVIKEVKLIMEVQPTIQKQPHLILESCH